ncbi:glutamine-hydrolyzing GMP synthase [Candidatus Magnetominusculus xianensis]|uniref:GMP synthase [glutamine-hydrolyzing] n=1 Tax=Candidatus Magnetominusculus xianensis TaxID=1748249 RepID=A0ABR5SG03_9BACT|nr:glutamine-hydrolyzing GMP synthase [Candidatus Magnetominusculus xianensis]KWT83686.1 GMP synthase [Candidatus Magnetominusculus xianensis]MBF0402616.1 glutamine-hydrolyzing GMP synthase [Nitrospirota bacterium]
MLEYDKILVLDFGSQYTQLIARRIRERKVYSEIFPYNAPIEKIRGFKPKGIVLSGGPASIYEKDAPIVDKSIFDLGVPILGICYGMQLIVHLLGGEVERAQKREYGRAALNIDNHAGLLSGLSEGSVVWMSHGDSVKVLPAGGFTSIARTSNSTHAAIADDNRMLYALQFHPEVAHTQEGDKILDNFVHGICKCSAAWQMSSFIEYEVEAVRQKVGSGNVVCALSGGVDSSVAAILIHKAIGQRLHCIFVDNGLLRKNEKAKVIETFKKHYNLNLIVVDAEKRFLERLKGITDPEQKRKIIGREFIAVFEEEAKKLGAVEYLVQGTLYPDVIESVSFKGPSATIKSHHNVGGLPEVMNLKLIEPLRELFKDEVREIGVELGLPDEICYRQPFPGPGLAIRCIGELSADRLKILREADAIVIEEIKNAGLYREIWQSFAVLLPLRTVGVMGDERTYDYTIAMRAVNSVDGMTADWARVPYEVLSIISNRIINEVKGVNRVVFDITSKPPGTIEWE